MVRIVNFMYKHAGMVLHLTILFNSSPLAPTSLLNDVANYSGYIWLAL